MIYRTIAFVLTLLFVPSAFAADGVYDSLSVPASSSSHLLAVTIPHQGTASMKARMELKGDYDIDQNDAFTQFATTLTSSGNAIAAGIISTVGGTATDAFVAGLGINAYNTHDGVFEHGAEIFVNIDTPNPHGDAIPLLLGFGGDLDSPGTAYLQLQSDGTGTDEGNSPYYGIRVNADYANVLEHTTGCLFCSGPTGYLSGAYALRFLNASFSQAYLEFDSFKVDGSGVITKAGGFTSYSPTVSSYNCTLSSTTASGHYYDVGPIRYYDINFSINASGIGNCTSASALYVTLPSTPVTNGITCATGRENNLTGKPLFCFANTGDSKLTVQYMDQSYPGASGRNFTISGWYRTL